MISVFLHRFVAWRCRRPRRQRCSALRRRLYDDALQDHLSWAHDLCRVGCTSGRVLGLAWAAATERSPTVISACGDYLSRATPVVILPGDCETKRGATPFRWPSTRPWGWPTRPCSASAASDGDAFFVRRFLRGRVDGKARLLDGGRFRRRRGLVDLDLRAPAEPGAARASWFICLAPALVASFDVPSSAAAAGAAAALAFGLADSSFSLKPMFAPVLADVRSRGAALTAGSTARALFFAGAGAGAALEGLAFGAGFAAAGFGAGALAFGAAFAFGLAAVGFFGFGRLFYRFLRRLRVCILTRTRRRK